MNRCRCPEFPSWEHLRDCPARHDVDRMPKHQPQHRRPSVAAVAVAEVKARMGRGRVA